MINKDKHENENYKTAIINHYLKKTLNYSKTVLIFDFSYQI